MHEVGPNSTNRSTVALQEQKTIKVEETLEPVELVAIRLTVVKEFTDPAVWKSARRNGQRVLDMEPSLIKLDVWTNGWLEAEISKNDTGYLNMVRGTEQAVLNPDSCSGKALITAERLKSDPTLLRQMWDGWKETRMKQEKNILNVSERAQKRKHPG